MLQTITIAIFFFAVMPAVSQNNIGVFNSNSDVGAVIHKGRTQYNASTQEYTISGAGSNIWFNHDEFQYAWKKLKGNFILQARGILQGKGVELHRKLGWMVRNSLDTNAAMITAAVHGDGLTSLQYRKTINADVEENKSPASAPDIIQLERIGNRYIMSTAHFGEAYTVVEVSDLDLGEEVYAGLFVCSHNKDVTETAVFDNVRIIIPAKEDFVPYRDYIGSYIETMDVTNGKRQIIYSDKRSLQAPNWTIDNKSLIYNSNGLMYKLDFGSSNPQVINTGSVKQNNNDHVISFNGKMLGLSASGVDAKMGSLIYIVPVKGGVPKQVTATGPSYLHGWSPDGRYLVYTGERNNEFDIYRIAVHGGKEERLTTATGLDDGSEYSPDGNYIYFNSVRSGMMQLWRMKPDGSNQEQLTADEYNNWFPHISPDGKWIVFLSFNKDIPADDHPFYKQVYLRLMPANGGRPTIIGYVYGGQATINTPSWSPDSKKIAFVSNSDMK